MPNRLIQPHGGDLVDLIVPSDEQVSLKEASLDWTSLDLTPRQICDLELLMNGGFSPLRGFMCREDYDGVVSSMRLSNGVLWPIPVTLDVPQPLAETLEIGEMLALRDVEGVMLAAIHVQSVWQPDRDVEADGVYGTTDPSHTGVDVLMNQTATWCVGGEIKGLQLPDHYDSKAVRHSPSELRSEFQRLGWRRIVAFQTRNPMHRAHFELTMRAIRQYESNLLIHPVVGMTKYGDVDHYTRVRCYQALLGHYPLHSAKLALLPLSMRLAGPRSALWHALIRKNFGCTHMIVGRDHAGPGQSASGDDFYGHYDAQELVLKFEEESGIEMVPFSHLVYVENRDRYMPSSEVDPEDRILNISGTALRRRLADGREIPTWFTFPEVARELQRSYPPRVKQGFAVIFTGLSGSGKSTVAKVLQVKLLEIGGRPVTLLDGDVVRTNLSSELGFSRDHRNLNIQRIGFVANEITKNGGIAICAPIAPYDSVRKDVCTRIRERGGCILVHIATPMEVCEARDRKGLYAKARAGILKEFTGISDPYEIPEDADLKIDTTDLTPEEACQQVLLHLEHEGYVG